jgi:O-antigen/teichoic acid export membrane protein
MLGSYAVLMNADLIFVKHYFSPDDAGKFAKAATVGRSVIFLPLPIALVMFPKVISGGTDKRDSRATFLKSLGLVVFLIIGAVGMTMTFPWLPLHILYGIRDPDPELIRLLIYVVCAMAPLSLSFLLMNYEIAQHRFAMTWLLAFSAFLYIAGVALWHDTMEHVVYVLGTVSTITTVGFCAGILLRARHRRHTGVS